MDKSTRRRPAALGTIRPEPGNRIHRATWAGVGLCLLLSGCAGESVSNAGNAPASPPTVGAAAPASDRQKVLGPFTLEVPSGWVEQTPRSRMRRAQFALPRESGDSEDGELTVFYFGMGQGGSTDANISRWIGQVSQPDGSSSRGKAKIRQSQVSGFRMTEVDVSGTLKASNMPGAPRRPERPGYRLLGAVLESPQGPWFFKVVGPEKTIGRWAESFRQFIASAKSQ
ncbi:MAG: hypothetical protein OXG96_03855 [Acidobacteria bacterium]|nr:hypothetical protein [Acidobacteriota bacterium]